MAMIELQMKVKIGSVEPINNVTLKLTFIVYIVLVLNTVVLNTIFMFGKRSLFGSSSERRIVNGT